MSKILNVYIRPLVHSDAVDLLNLEKKNRAFFENYSITQPENYWTLETHKELIEKWEQNTKQELEYRFGIFKIDGDVLIGTIGLFQVLRGPRQSALLGYSLDKEHNGKGYTTEATNLVVDYAFENLNLHRIEAGVMPDNIGSIRVLEKAGFHKEGVARKNVEINGRWEDHQMLAILNPNH
ncbi:GNAT family N-acetyltransferase [Psychrobacillus sp. INOP01]|uniref:GNAT family N-acetyltransferase n=1 Tax=Psychrobacillus sp. INOP01 TaxID=2829187 RepID=UPI001BA61CCD|nr:GNAT family protein [Psychrobacillus sp. INOP01]QUG41561.1 GNAT family N-acetyltransferase [Psychrobacillus sp. INOP01]